MAITVSEKSNINEFTFPHLGFQFRKIVFLNIFYSRFKDFLPSWQSRQIEEVNCEKTTILTENLFHSLKEKEIAQVALHDLITFFQF